MKFEIEEIDNGYLVKGDFGWEENARGEFMDDFTLFASCKADAFALIAHKCDQLMDDEMNASNAAPPNQDDLPF